MLASLRGRFGGRSWLITAGCVELISLGLLAWWPGPGLPLPALALFFVAFGAYAATSLGWSPRRRDLAWIWGFAIVFRLVLLPAPPELSDDVFRYLWDGHVQLEGVNPYRFAPSDPALADLRTEWHDRINNPDVPTIYPPVAQMAFVLIGLLGGLIVHAKILWLSLDLLTGWVLGQVADATGRSRPGILVLYLWCPLLVVETAWSGHLEPLGLLGLSALVLLGWRAIPPKDRADPAVVDDAPEDAAGNVAEDLARRERGALEAGVAAAATALAKFAPAAALPPLMRRLGWRFALAFSITAVALYAPYLGAGSDLWQGLFTYVRDWRFMVGPFGLLEAILPGRWPPRIGAAVVVGGVIAWTTLHAFSPERALFWILGAGLLFSPTVHPWYVLWILPFAALRSSGPWILLSGLVFLGYWGLGPFLETGDWPQPGWLRILVWGPPLAWLAAGFCSRLLGARNGSSQTGHSEGQIASAE